MSDYTKTPWEIDTDGCMEICTHDEDGERRSIAKVPIPEDYPGWEDWGEKVINRVRKVSSANLKLMAASPEMFRLLCKLDDLFNWTEENNMMPKDVKQDEVIKEVRPEISVILDKVRN